MRLVVIALLLASPLAAQFRNFKGKECRVSTDAPAAIGKTVAKRIDNFYAQFAEFYKPLKLERKNDNKLVARVFNTYDDYAVFCERRGLARPPRAFFSPSDNAIVLYNDEKDVTLRQTLFHECSHNFMNRYIYERASWLNEGLAEYFEGWRITPEGELIEVRMNLYDLQIVREALEEGEGLDIHEMFGMSGRDWKAFRTTHPDLHGYLHYCTAWSVVYYCLEGGHEGDRESLVNYFRDLNELGSRAVFDVGDPAAFERRWREWVLSVDAAPSTAEDHLLIADGHRSGGDVELALASYAAALDLDPETPGALYGRGYCEMMTGDFDAAVETLTRVMQDEPDNARAPYLLARIALGIDKEDAPSDPARAIELIEEALDRVDGKSPTYLLLKARAQDAGGDAKAAVKTTRKILAMVKEDEEATATYDVWLDRFKESERAQKR